MPKSRRRKGAASYRPKGIGYFGIPDPAQVFWDLGRGRLSGAEGDRAAQHLLDNMAEATAGNTTMQETFPGEWPPTTTAELIDLAKRAYQKTKEEEASAAQS